MNRWSGLIGFIVVIALSYFAIPVLLQPGFFPMHDDTQVTRVYEMTGALTDGMFPVRWVKDLGYGYGYPIFNFYAPLAYYVGSLFMLAGQDALSATKLMIALGILFAGITMYFLGRSLWGTLGGIVSAALYVYAPYHALNVFVRGAIAETWAYAFVPLAFFGIWKVYTDRKWRYVIVGAVGLAGVVLSHNLTAMMILPYYMLLLVIFCILLVRSTRNWSWILLPLTFLLGLSLSAFYWLPAILEMQFTNVASQIGGGSMYSDHFVCLSQLWDSMWGFGGSVPGCIDGLSFKLGKIYILFSLTAFILGLIFIRSDNRKRNAVVLIFIGLISAAFFTLPFSAPIWHAVKPMAYFQFPWRFLLLASFFSSLLSGAIPYAIEQKNSNVKIYFYLALCVGIVMIGLTIYQSSKLFVPQRSDTTTAVDYTDHNIIVWKISKISDEYMPKSFIKPKKEADVIKNKITSIESLPEIKIHQDSTTELSATIQTNRPVRLLVNIAYFPGWNIYIDNKKVDYIVRKNGMEIAVPAGRHEVYAVLTSTDIEKTADWISLVGIGALFIGIIVAWRIKKL